MIQIAICAYSMSFLNVQYNGQYLIELLIHYIL